jgi:hypothetical protein
MGGLAPLWWGIVCSALWLRLDAPLAPPSNYTVYSLNQRFYAFLDAGKKKTTVFEVRKGAAAIQRWEMPGWFRVAALSDDGEHLVAGFDGINLLPLEYHKDQVMLSFYRRGKLLCTVTLGQLVKDYGKLQRTASHYYWGRYLGFDEKNRYLVATVEGRTIAFDAATGQPAAAR